MTTIYNIVERLRLQPHPEGGYYRETYRSNGVIPGAALPEPFEGSRNYATSIYFLLTSDSFSAFHRIRQDEVWHFYDGAPICLHILNADGVYEKYLLGRDMAGGQLPQLVVLAGNWFASEVCSPGKYSLAGCTVSPGFDFADFELAGRNDLIGSYPDHRDLITRLTRS